MSTEPDIDNKYKDSDTPNIEYQHKGIVSETDGRMLSVLENSSLPLSEEALQVFLQAFGINNKGILYFIGQVPIKSSTGVSTHWRIFSGIGVDQISIIIRQFVKDS